MSAFTFFTGGKQEGVDKTVHKNMETPGYKRLQEGYKEWLQLLNFNQSTIYHNPLMLREFLCWLEQHHIRDISQVNRQTTAKYFEYLQTRQHYRKSGRLQPNTLRAHQQTLRRFARYLQASGQDSFEVTLQLPAPSSKIKPVLTREEIARLYQSTEDDIWGTRDRAMLAVYYGCGLRRSEGVALDVSDVLIDKQLLYVRQGKNYQERYVPMSAAVSEQLQEYIKESRPSRIKAPEEALFTGRTGARLQGPAMAERFKKLLEKAGIDKPAGLHTLRHSIATHLLASGMQLEQISRFLGHSSLESTQIYTHLLHEQASK